MAFMPDEDKVIKLLNAFQVPELAWAKGTIKSNAHYRTNYDAAVAFLADTVRASKPTAGTNRRNLSAYQRDGGGKKPPKKGGGKGKSKWTFDPKNPGRYCPNPVFRKLPKDIQQKIRDANRDKRNKRDNEIDSKFDKLTSQISAMQTSLNNANNANNSNNSNNSNDSNNANNSTARG